LHNISLFKVFKIIKIEKKFKLDVESKFWHLTLAVKELDVFVQITQSQFMILKINQLHFKLTFNKMCKKYNFYQKIGF